VAALDGQLPQLSFLIRFDAISKGFWICVTCLYSYRHGLCVAWLRRLSST